MEAVERIKLEIQKHRQSIIEYKKKVSHEKSEMNRILFKMNQDESGENDLTNYGLIHSYSDRICSYLKEIKNLQKLIMMKLEISTKHSEK